MLTRTVLVAGVTAAAVVGAAVAPAFAADGWGSVECEQIPSPTCDLGTGTDGDSPPDIPPEDPNDDPSGDGPGDAEEPPPGDEIVDFDPNLADCEYERTDYVPPETTVQASAPMGQSPVIVHALNVPSAALTGVSVPPEGDQPGGWYVYQCSGEGFRDALWRPPIWIPDADEPDDSGGPSVIDVARQAYNQLRLGSPTIGISPAGDQLVHLPTWLWVDGWNEVSSTASVPGVSVTATATPQVVSWSTGDDGAVRCDGPGTPYAGGDDPASGSPDCGHTYRVSSAGQPGEEFTVTATVEWTVTWSGAGQSGTFPGLTTEAATQVGVVESHALNTR